MKISYIIFIFYLLGFVKKCWRFWFEVIVRVCRYWFNVRRFFWGDRVVDSGSDEEVGGEVFLGVRLEVGY